MTYVKKNQVIRKKWIIGISLLFMMSVGITAYNLLPKQKAIPVFQEKLKLELPVFESDEKQAIKPFKEGIVSVAYFNGTSQDVISVIEYEGVYRPSQGVAITHNQASFEVFATLDGEVMAVKNDPMLGDSVQIQSNEYVITYQCLTDIQVEKGMKVKQNDYLGKASNNLYQSQLGNHLNLIVEKNGQIIDPKLLIPLN